jgi:hypothetical protein
VKKARMGVLHISYETQLQIQAMMSLNEIREEEWSPAVEKDMLRFLESAMRIADVTECNEVDRECA